MTRQGELRCGEGKKSLVSSGKVVVIYEHKVVGEKVMLSFQVQIIFSLNQQLSLNRLYFSFLFKMMAIMITMPMMIMMIIMIMVMMTMMMIMAIKTMIKHCNQ